MMDLSRYKFGKTIQARRQRRIACVWNGEVIYEGDPRIPAIINESRLTRYNF